MEIAHGDAPIVIDKFVCNAGRALERHRRAESDKNKNAPEGWNDGLHYFARPVDPERDKPARPPLQRGGKPT